MYDFDNNQLGFAVKIDTADGTQNPPPNQNSLLGGTNADMTSTPANTSVSSPVIANSPPASSFADRNRAGLYGVSAALLSIVLFV